VATHVINYLCAGDTYIDADNPNLAYGGNNPIVIGGYSYLTGWSDKRRYTAFLRFTKSGLPARKREVSSKLKLYLSSVIGSGNGISFQTGSQYDALNLATLNFNSFGGPAMVSGNTTVMTTVGWNEILITGFAMINTSTLAVGQKPDLDTAYQANLWNFISNEAGSNAPYVEVTYEDVPPSPSTGLTPTGSYEVSSDIIRLAWLYISTVGGTQKGFSVQWSTDGATWNTISQTTENQYYDMPANTLPAGNIYWRVQTVNEYDEVSGYSSNAVFYSIAAPTTPVVSATNISRPVVSWTSDADQQVYQLQALSGATVVYDSGVLVGMTTRTHDVKAFLIDGTYTIQARYKNQYDIWSAWGTLSHVISTTEPAAPTLTLSGADDGIVITPGSLSAYASAILYRDTIPIAIITGAYTDRSVAHGKSYEYFIRGVTATSFADSAHNSRVASLVSDYLSLASSPSTKIALTTSAEITGGKSSRKSQASTATYYLGRSRAVQEFSGFEDVVTAATYYFSTYAEIEVLEAIADMRQVVLFRDRKGRKLYGTVTLGITTDTVFGFTVPITITGVDYDEEVTV